MKILYIISQSPFKRRDPILYLRLAEAGDSVIFIQNGVYASRGMIGEMGEEFEEAKKRGVKFYFLKEDIEARGLSNCCENVVDYDGFLKLIKENEKVVH